VQIFLSHSKHDANGERIARLMYGGDLRPEGFTEVLFELVARHRRDADSGDERVGVGNFLAWPVHVSQSANQLRQLSEAIMGVAELIFLNVDGEVIPEVERQQLLPRPATPDEWANGLTAMRDFMTSTSNARVVLGGRVEGFKGRTPGVAEETLITLRAGQPLFIFGGFGGCARDIAEELGLAQAGPITRPLGPAAATSRALA
jgi:hypothetical protein